MSTVRSKQVIRQDTFDTDPNQTLRSKSGGIKRGSLALPVIDSGPANVHERSFESLPDNDKLSVIVISDSALKAKKRKTENPNASKQNRVINKDAKEILINDKDKKPDKKTEPTRKSEVNKDIIKKENNKSTTENNKHGSEKPTKDVESTLKAPNKESKPKESRGKVGNKKKENYIIDETRYEKVDLDAESENNKTKQKTSTAQLKPTKQKGDGSNASTEDKKHVAIIDSAVEPKRTQGNKKNNKKLESDSIVLEPRNAKQRKVQENFVTESTVDTNNREKKTKTVQSHSDSSLPAKDIKTGNAVKSRKPQTNGSTKSSGKIDSKSKDSSLHGDNVSTVSDNLVQYENASVNNLPPKDTTLILKQGSIENKYRTFSDQTDSDINITLIEKSDKTHTEQKETKESKAVTEKGKETNTSVSRNKEISHPPNQTDYKDRNNSFENESYVSASKVNNKDTSSERHLPSSLSIRSSDINTFDKPSRAGSRSPRSVEKHYHGSPRAPSTENNTPRYHPQEKHHNEGSKVKSSIMEPSSQRTPGSERMVESYESVYAERQSLLDAEATYRKRIKQLEDEMNQFLKTIEDLRAENKVLRNKVDELESADSKTDRPNVVDQQSKTTIVIDTEKAELNKKIVDLEHDNKDLNLMVTESKAKERLTASENKKLIEEIERLRNNLESGNDEIEIEAKGIDPNVDLKEENERMKTEAASLRLSRDKIKLEAEKLKEEEEKAKQEVEKIKLEMEKVTKELQKHQDEKDSVSGEKENKIKSETALKSEIEEIKIENKKLEAELEKYKDLSTPRDGGKNLSPDSENMELKAQIITLQTENQKLNEEIIKLKAEHLENVRKIHDLEKVASTFQKSVTSVESEKLTEIQTLSNENSDLKDQVKKLNEAMVQKKRELDELMVVMKDDKFEDEIKELKESKIKLTKDIERKDEDIKKLSQELKDLKLEQEKFESEKKVSEESFKSLSILNDQRKDEIKELTNKFQKANEELEAGKRKLAGLDNAEKVIAEAKEEADKLSKDMENVRIKHDKEVKDITEKQSKENREWQDKYARLEKEFQQEVKRLKEEIARLKEEINRLEEFRVRAFELEETRSELLLTQKKVSQMTVELEEHSQVELRNFELTMKLDQTYKRVAQLEKEAKAYIEQKQKFEEIESNNTQLIEENTKLRNSLGGKGTIDTKLEVLERKQKDAETRVKQLEGWVGDLYTDDKPSGMISKVTLGKEAKNKEKQPFSKSDSKTKEKKKANNKRPRSLEDVEINVEKEEDKQTTHSSTPSLPNIFDRERNPLTYGLGYAQIYRKKMVTASKNKK